jgi:hypothetical protein
MKHQDAFKEAVVALMPGIAVSDVAITSIETRTSASGRRRLQEFAQGGKMLKLFGRQVLVKNSRILRELSVTSGTYLEVSFEIQTRDHSKFQEAKEAMENEVTGSSGTRKLAKNLMDKGVVDSLDSVEVLEVEIEIVVVKSPVGFFDKLGNIMIVVAAGVSVFILSIVVYCGCRKKRKRPASPRISVSNSNKDKD